MKQKLETKKHRPNTGDKAYQQDVMQSSGQRDWS